MPVGGLWVPGFRLGEGARSPGLAAAAPDAFRHLSAMLGLPLPIPGAISARPKVVSALFHVKIAEEYRFFLPLFPRQVGLGWELGGKQG